MSAAIPDLPSVTNGPIFPELDRLRERIGALPPRFRDVLRPIADEAVEHALFRGRVLALAREGLERYRLDLAIARFDLEATRREQEALRRRIEALGGV
jgi:hypothetical protein